jgi:chemotaxis protein CheX
MEITAQIIGPHLVIQCPFDLDADAVAAIENELVCHTLDNLKGVVLDFAQTKKFDHRAVLPFLAQLGKRLRTLGRKQLFAANAGKEVKTEIRNGGLDSIVLFLDAEDASPAAKPKRSLNVEFVNPFIDSTMNTLKTQCATELKAAEKPFLKGTRELPGIEIAGIIGLTSTEFSGSISICFPKDTFLGVMKGMLGEDFKEITPDLQDGAAELLNIIFGGAKRALNENGYGIEKAIPSVVRAQDLQVKQLTQSPTLILLFNSASGPLYLEIAIEG